MGKKPKPEPDDPEQSRRFVETAKQLEVDDSGKSFEKAVGLVKPSIPGSELQQSTGKRSHT